MILNQTTLEGAYIIELNKMKDERGYFARTFCRKEFVTLGLSIEIAQSNISFNALRGTLRGMHYQVEPAAETKLVQCVCGSLYDVIIDLRPKSKTYCQWFGLELSANRQQLLYVPEGFAHGFQTLEENTTLYYQMSAFYTLEYSRGVRWNDPAFGIKWPFADPVMSDKDRQLPDYQR